jgi:hypothetical protein
MDFDLSHPVTKPALAVAGITAIAVGIIIAVGSGPNRKAVPAIGKGNGWQGGGNSNWRTRGATYETGCGYKGGSMASPALWIP